MITDITEREIQLRTRSKLGVKPARTIKFADDFTTIGKNMIKLEEYYQYWEALDDFRTRFRKNVDYLRGRQLEDYVENDAGETVTQSEYISEQGKTPFVQNIIAPVFKSIEGLFRQDAGQSVVVSRKPESARIEKMLTNAVQSVLSANEVKEIDPRTLEYFFASGLPVQKIGFDFVDYLRRYEVVIDYIDPNYLFWNNDIQDIRGKDLRLIGQIHDLTFDELFVHFAESETDKRKLREIYGSVDTRPSINYDALTKDRVSYLDFYVPSEPHKCRVIEAWEKRAVDVIEVHDEADGSEGIWEGDLDQLNQIANSRYEKYRAAGIPEEEIPRIHYKYTVSFRWFYKYLSPSGHVLREGISPYHGHVHPFVVAPYPLISGEVFGAAETLIDIQDQFNRMFTLMDFIMGTSAKNTLVLDEASLNGQNPEDIAADYRRVGGVIVLKLKDGAKPPQELKNLGIDRAMFEIIQMYTKLMQDISGVQPALMGQNPGAGVPASRFVAETQNSIINLRPLLDFFSSFRRKRDMKVLHMIMQFYKSPRYMAVSGASSDQEKLFDPSLIKNAIDDFDLVIAKGSDSPVFKAMNDEMLKEFVVGGLIPMELFLKHTDFPFSKPLLEDIQNTREQVQNGQQSPQQAISVLQNAVSQNIQ